MSILRTARGIMSLIQPLTGTRSTGNVTITATGADVEITADEPLYGVPIVNGALNYDAVIKTVGAHTVTDDGVAVTCRSLLGGTQNNLAEDTVIRWDPPIPGLTSTGIVLDGGMAGAANPTAYGASVFRVKQHEQLGSANAAEELFAAKIGKFPAAVLIWGSMGEPRYVQGKLTRTVRLYEQEWTLALVVSRVDSSEQRRQEVFELLDSAIGLLVERNATEDGEAISAPSGLTILRASRIATLPTSFIYGITFTTQEVSERREWREFADWLVTRVDIDTQSGDVRGELPIIEDARIDMRPDE